MGASELNAVWELLSEEVTFDWRKKQSCEDMGKVFLKQGEQQVERSDATHVKNAGKIPLWMSLSNKWQSE